MDTWRSQIDVRAEPEKVLETLTDVEACEAWSPVGFEVDGLDSGRLSAGAEVAVSGAIAGCRVRFHVEIVLADSERLVLRAAGPVEMLAHYVVRPAADGSRVDAAISVRRGTGAGARLAARATSILLGAGALKQTLARIAHEAERRHEASCTRAAQEEQAQQDECGPQGGQRPANASAAQPRLVCGAPDGGTDRLLPGLDLRRSTT
jgi:carbon monoxide dehydrogenase subunit G